MLSAQRGTLVILLVRLDGIYLAADSRRGKQHDDAEKLVRAGPQTILALRGHPMLVDNETGAVILAAHHFQDKLTEPITVARHNPNASWKERDASGRAAALSVRTALEPFVNAFAQEWNTGELTAEGSARVKSGGVMLGLTVAQSEPDGWLLAIDLQYKIAFDDNKHIGITPASGTVVQNGPYHGDKIQPYWPPHCENVVRLRPPEELDDPTSFLQTVFAAVIKSSTACAEAIGLPVDIAKIHLGIATAICMKRAWPQN